MKDFDENGNPKVRVGYTKSIESDYLIVHVPSVSHDCVAKFDGINYYIDWSREL